MPFEDIMSARFHHAGRVPHQFIAGPWDGPPTTFGDLSIDTVLEAPNIACQPASICI
jgi:hypothetical protein